MLEKLKLPIMGTIIALGVILSTLLVTNVIRDVRLSHQIIKVRGYAEKEVESDLVIWEIRFAITSRDIAKDYSRIEEHRDKISTYLDDQGVKESEIKIGSVNRSERMKRDNEGNTTNIVDYYILSQKMEITSKDVYKIEKVATSITQLMKYGISIESYQPKYYYSKINDIKSELLTEATKDARFRAKTLAEGSGVRLGYLRAARQGSFSIRSAKDTNISTEDYYDDTASIKKKITAVVTVDYSMQ
jgi:hypothetical protein